MIRITKPPRLHGTLTVPGDKSISHRGLILAGLASGRSSLRGLSSGKDVASTQRVLRQLGVEMIPGRGGELLVLGKGAAGLKEPESVLHCGNSGTTARLMAGVLARQRFFSVLTGDASLRARPMARVVKPLREMGARIWGRQGDTKLPLAIQGGRLRGIRYELPVASAQVKTCLLLAGLGAEGETEILEPAPSRDHTERLFSWLGLPLQKEGPRIRLRPAEVPAFQLEVPGDFSSAAYFLALGALHGNAQIEIRGVNLNPTRTAFLRVLERMGARVQVSLLRQEPEPVGDVVVQSSRLRNVPVSLEEIPGMIDEIPLLAVVATQAQGTFELRGAAELRVKESDRLHAIVTQLRKMGAAIEELPDGFRGEGGVPLRGVAVNAGPDHRIAMALAVAGSVAEGETVLRGERWVAISFPEFFDLLRQIGGTAQ